MAYGSSEELEVWRRGRRVAVRVYEVSKECGSLGLRDRMTRAGVSTAGNNAETISRQHIRKPAS